MELQIMCQTDVLRKRPHDDHDSDHHEGECAKRQKTIKETSSIQETSSNQQQDDVYFGSGNDDIVDVDMYDDELTEVIYLVDDDLTNIVEDVYELEVGEITLEAPSKEGNFYKSIKRGGYGRRKIVYTDLEFVDLLNLESDTHDGYDFLRKIEVLRKMELSTSLQRQTLKVIYEDSGYQEKSFKLAALNQEAMDHTEVHKFYNYTMEEVKGNIFSILLNHEYKYANPPLTEDQVLMYEKMIKAIKRRHKFKRQMTRIDGYIGARALKKGSLFKSCPENKDK
ncbi:hypothetical protein Tco_0413039 [Tanacetum coccineum]